MKKWRITDTCGHCGSSVECHANAETQAEARKIHRAGDSEYISGDASVPGDEIEIEEIENE